MSNSYKNRIGNNLNRRKLTIVSQTANEMIVDVERADSIEQGNEGTPITASTLNSFEDRIATAESNSSVALSNASTALSNSTSAVSDASTALSNSTQALSAANSAYSTVQTLESQIGERGAIVKVNNVAQTEINFSSDPQTQLDTKTNVKVNNSHISELNFTSDPQTQLNGKQNTLIFDTSPTSQSTNMVRSGAIYSALYNGSIPTVNVYDATITNTSKNVTSNGHVLVTKTRSKRILEFYFNTINMSNFLDKDVNTSCLIQTVIPALSNVNSGYFLGVILSQTNASVTNDYMNSHSAQSGNISSFASSNTAFACTVTMRRAYSESNQYACLVVKIVEELL